VVIGDIGNAWTYDLLNNVFRLVTNGAELVALHRNKFWQTEAGLQMDIGAFVAGLEYVTGKTATVTGKPSPEFFAAALSRIGLKPGEVAMIGDDIDTDIGAAQAQGMMGILVKTGKYREAYVRASKIKPDLVLDSIADMGGLLKT
jgi:HAD superfamily hydrolase (TIGR01458 family)